jgi:hypothetical protein
MKTMHYFFAASLLCGALAAGTARADPPGKTVTVVNNTQYTVNELYASESDDSSWDTSNNLLAGNAIGAGQQTTVTIPDASGQCQYDLMGILYGAAQYAYQYQVDACDAATWTISQ